MEDIEFITNNYITENNNEESSVNEKVEKAKGKNMKNSNSKSNNQSTRSNRNLINAEKRDYKDIIINKKKMTIEDDEFMHDDSVAPDAIVCIDEKPDKNTNFNQKLFDYKSFNNAIEKKSDVKSNIGNIIIYVN